MNRSAQILVLGILGFVTTAFFGLPSAWAVKGGAALPAGDWTEKSTVIHLVDGLDKTPSECSFVIVGPRHLLTAGHCAEGYKAGMVVYSKSSNLQQTGHHKVEAVIMHRNYKVGWDRLGNGSNPDETDRLLATVNTDIAVIRFYDNFDYPVMILPLSTKDDGNANATLVAAGRGDDGRLGLAQKLSYQIDPYAYRRKDGVVMKPQGVFSADLAVPKANTGACHADSGSAFYVYQNARWELFGILSTISSSTSREIECGSANLTTLFVPVFGHLDWILPEMTGKNG